MNKLNCIEKYTFLFVFYVLTLGILISFIDESVFRSVYVREDGLVETLTVIMLLIGSAVCFRRIFKLRSSKPKWFLVCTGILALILIFGAGEEISWGQRLIKDRHINTYFQQNNAQGETNLHNLKFNGKSVNKIIFGTGLSIFLVFYLLLFPYLYRLKFGFKRFIDSFAIPLAQRHQVLFYLFLFLASFLINSSKKSEILEFGGTCIFLMIIMFPLNKDIFEED